MNENKKEIKLDGDRLIKRVYNKIALWNNQDGTSEDKSVMLKVLAHDIVTDVLSTAFEGLDGAKFKEVVAASSTEKKKKGFFRKRKKD